MLHLKRWQTLAVALMELAVLLVEVVLAWVEAVLSFDYSMANLCLLLYIYVSQSILCFWSYLCFRDIYVYQTIF